MKATSTSNESGTIKIKQSKIDFGTTPDSTNRYANPVELFLSSFSACILKNVARFSDFLKFEYSHAEIKVTATRLDKPPRMDEIKYKLKIYSQDPKFNTALLKKNIEKFGTIVNTVKQSCNIEGKIIQIKQSA